MLDVMDDAVDVQAHLQDVLGHWLAQGPLEELCGIVDEVWLRNRTVRYETSLGDDPTVLGIQCSRNILNLAKRRLGGVDVEDVSADGGLTLQVRFDGHALHTSKVGSSDPTWDPNGMSWESSGVRQDAAAANSRGYAPADDTLFQDLPGGAMSPAGSSLAGLSCLHLAWQGLPEGGTRIWVGFPQVGEQPWLAVALVRDASRPGAGGMPVDDEQRAGAPDHDALAPPPLPQLRRRDRRDGDVRPASGQA